MLQIATLSWDGTGDIQNADLAFPIYYKCGVYFLAVSIYQTQQLHGPEEKPVGKRNAVHLFLCWDYALLPSPCWFGHVCTWGMPPCDTWVLRSQPVAASTRESRVSGKHWEIFKKCPCSEKLTLWRIGFKAVFLEMESLLKRKASGKDHSKPKHTHVAVNTTLCLKLAISAPLQLQNTSSFTFVHTHVLFMSLNFPVPSG